MVGVVAIGPFLNFKLDKKSLVTHILDEVYNNKEKYGHSKVGEGKTIVVEFSSPNIAKPFHAGHLRSTIIGNFIANVYETLGYKTVRINYLGDWGKQYGVEPFFSSPFSFLLIFSWLESCLHTGLLAVGFQRYGSEKELEEDPIKHLFNVYVKINVRVFIFFHL